MVDNVALSTKIVYNYGKRDGNWRRRTSRERDEAKASDATPSKDELMMINITQLVDQCKSFILIGYATIGLLVIVIE